MSMQNVFGIDLGTTNSVVAVMEGGDPVVITTTEGSRLLPSVVGFNKSSERLVGIPAKRRKKQSPRLDVSGRNLNATLMDSPLHIQSRNEN